MEHFENLKPGDWVVVTGHRHLESSAEEVEYDMWGGVKKQQKPEFSGNPAKILAVSFPFICVEQNGQVNALDSRVYRVNKVNSRYVKAMSRAVRQVRYHPPAQSQWDTSSWLPSAPTISSIQTTQGPALPWPKTCPACQEAQMTETLKEGDQEWKLSCPECGFTGTRPKGKDDG